jgi:hypothetical protein
VLIGEVDEDIVRLVAHGELEEAKAPAAGADNVFTMVRKIGQAKALLAADYAVQLQRSVGKVVFFAKHIDVMDAAEAHFAASGLRTISIRGDQTTPARQQAIDAFNTDPGVAIAVCSLTAAGVGLNMQAASNVVLAELSGPPPSRRRRSTACTASVRTSRSPRGGSSPRTRSTRRSRSSSTRSRACPARPRRRAARPDLERFGAAVGAHAPAAPGARRRLRRAGYRRRMRWHPPSIRR